jgi:hypothetical protein
MATDIHRTLCDNDRKVDKKCFDENATPPHPYQTAAPYHPFQIRLPLLTVFHLQRVQIPGERCQLTDLVYDGVFEVLQWLLFLSAVLFSY